MPGLVPEWAIVGRPAVICCEWNVDDDDDDDGDDNDDDDDDGICGPSLAGPPSSAVE